jgi:hypothetical protein
MQAGWLIPGGTQWAIPGHPSSSPLYRDMVYDIVAWRLTPSSPIAAVCGARVGGPRGVSLGFWTDGGRGE